MKIAAYCRATNSNTNKRVIHFGQALGASLETRERPVECDLAIQAGFQISPAMKDAMDRRIPIIILENPVWHYGDKSATYTWGYNGLNGLSTGGYMGNRPIRPHPDLQPWKDHTDGDWTIFGQVENDKALRGADIYEWVEYMQNLYPMAGFREHPIMLDAREMADQESFSDCMARTSLAITYTSTVGAESVIAGTPTISDHAGSWAYDVSSRSTEPVRTPDRREWIAELSWRHWSTHESVDVNYILGGYGRAKADAEAGKYDNMSNGRAQ